MRSLFFFHFLLILFPRVVQLQNPESLSDIHRVKSTKFDFPDTTETIDWPLDLQEIAEYAIQSKTVIKFDINATHPVTFSLTKCDELVMAKTTPFRQSTLYLDGPWLQFFVEEHDQECKTLPQELTLQVYFGPNPTNGTIAFSQYDAFIPLEDSANQTTLIPLTVPGIRHHMVSMEEFFAQQESANETIVFLSTASIPIDIAVAKCGLDAVDITLMPSEAFEVGSGYLEKWRAFTHVYCPNKEFKWMLEFKTKTPSNQTTSGAIHISKIPHSTVNKPDLLTILIICIVIFILLIASTVFFVLKWSKSSTADRVNAKDTEMTVFERSKLTDAMDDI